MEQLGRIETAADGAQLEITRRLQASPDEVWSALTERDALDAWLGRMRYEPVVGSALTIDFGGGDGIFGEVLAFEPKRLFSFTWSENDEASSVVRFELLAGEGGTTLVLTHSRQPADMARRTAAGWHAHLELLIGFLAGKLPVWEDVYPPAQQAYAELVKALEDTP